MIISVMSQIRMEEEAMFPEFTFLFIPSPFRF